LELSFFSVLAAAGKSSSATVAANQVVLVATLSIATVAAVATNDLAVAKLSIATDNVAVAKLIIAAVAADHVVLVATLLLQPSQPLQPGNYLGTGLAGIYLKGTRCTWDSHFFLLTNSSKIRY
jgi:hypothetical protein